MPTKTVRNWSALTKRASVRPFCWRTRMARGAQAAVSRSSISLVLYREEAIARTTIRKRVPVADRWQKPRSPIPGRSANYLEDTYPDRLSLFGAGGGRAMGRMLNWWGRHQP